MRYKQLRIPSTKRFLYQAYLDLKTVEANIFGYDWPSELNIFEKAVIVLEDRRYLRHHGIDIRSVLRELIKHASFRKHGGASTIEMQFVRTCTGFREYKLRRKLYEMALAWVLLHRANKLIILRSYLNVAYFGSGLSGSFAASQLMYNRSPDDLEERQACELAAMLVYPRPLSPTPRWKANVERRATYGQRLLKRLSSSLEK